MSEPFELFPGFKVPPTDPSRDVKRRPMTIATPPQEEEEYDPHGPCDSGEDEYCYTCANTGSLDCHCGGDLCICRNNGEYPCPDCGG